MTPLQASRTLVEFVVWEMRTGDLPPDVREAAQVAAKTGAYPLREGPYRLYTEGPLLVTGFPHDETLPLLEERNVFPHQAGGVVRVMLAESPLYILIQDTSA